MLQGRNHASLKQPMGQGTSLQDNNATPYRAQVITDFQQQQGIPRIDWPNHPSSMSEKFLDDEWLKPPPCLLM